MQQLLGQAFDEAPVALSVIDAAGRHVAGNRRYREILGLGSGALDQLAVADITNPEDVAWTAGYLERLARGELSEFRTEKTFRRPDGSTIRCELTTTALRDDAGACSAYVGTIRPVVQPQTASDERLRRFLEHVDDAITLVDAEGNVIETTGRYTTILGYPGEFWERRSVFDLLAPEEIDRAVDMHAQLLGGSVPEVSGEFRVVAADGHPEYIRLRAVNLLDDPHVGGIVVSSRNVSDERRLRDELTRAHDEAHELAAARSLLIATVSHELRNPLHAVSGLAELLVQDDLPERARPIASSLARQLAALSTVTGDLLDATRSELGVIELRPSPVHLGQVFEDLAAISRQAIGSRPLDFRIEIEPELPDWILLDRDRLGQVLGNLVGNAVKFTDHGSIVLAARRDDSGQLHIEVTDTGVGIPAPELASVLEPFATASTGGAQRGAGLGLSVVRQLVGAMGGSIAVESEIGSGSSFTVALPLVSSAAPVPATATKSVSLRILVVEDDPVNQQLAIAQLEHLGHVPLVVGSGEAALELLQEIGAVDVVLMDEQLPGMSGTETAHALRAAGLVGDDVRMISITASASQARRAAFLAAGMDELLSKPLNLATLERALRVERPTSSDATGIEQVAAGDSPDELAVDVQVLSGLVAELDDPDTVRSLVEVFLRELPERLAIITDPGSPSAVRSNTAHMLGSGAAMVGASRLTAICRSIERGEPVSGEIAGLGEQVATALTAWLSKSD